MPLIGREHGKATNITHPHRGGRAIPHGAAGDPQRRSGQGPVAQARILWNPCFPLKKGDIFDVDKIRKAIENYTKLYGVYGYIDFTATPQIDVHDDTKTIDLTFDFDEQKQFFVRRIDFSGNTTTRDKVIRRELLLNEGDIFNNRYWELSLLRLNQLNYFDTIKPENAEIKRNTKHGHRGHPAQAQGKGQAVHQPDRRRQRPCRQLHRPELSDQQFPGLGRDADAFRADRQHSDERAVSVSPSRICSTGRFPPASPFPPAGSPSISRSRRRCCLGQKIQIDPNIEQDYNQNTTGVTVFASYPLRKFSFARLGLTYGYSDTSIQSFSTASTELFEALQFQSLAGPSALSGIHSSQITPTLTYNTVDNPINPTHGKSLFLFLRL